MSNTGEQRAINFSDAPQLAFPIADSTKALQSHATELRFSNPVSSLTTIGDSSVAQSLTITPIQSVLSSQEVSANTSGTPTRDIGTPILPPTADVPATASTANSSADTPTRVATASDIDASKSVASLIQEGVFQRPQEVKAQSDVLSNVEKLNPGESPKITVQFSDLSGQQTNQPKPDVLVKTDGTVVMLSDPETTKDRDVVVEVERKPGQIEPLKVAEKEGQPSQQEALDNVVKYLDARLGSQAQALPEIADNQGLISNEARHALRPQPPEQTAEQQRPPEQAPERPAQAQAQAQQQLPEQTQQAVNNMNRFNGSGGGSMSRKQANDYFPERDVPRQAQETDRIASVKEAVAALFNPDRGHAYETVRSRGDQGYAVGRYGLTQPLIWGWWNSEFGNIDPENPEAVAQAMEKLAKDGKVSKAFAAKFKDPKFAKQFGEFLNKMKSGKGGITKEEMQAFMPKELQETIATRLVKDFSDKAGGDLGKVALGFQLGKPPDQLTAEEMGTKSAKELMTAANRFEQLNTARQAATDDDRIRWDQNLGPTSETAFRLDKAAERVAARMNRTGLCATGVQVALDKVGLGEFVGSGNGWQMRHALMRSGKFVQVDASQAKEGDIMLRRWTGNDGGAGHVAVITGRDSRGLTESSDHTTRVLMNNPRYDKTMFLRYVGKDTQNA